MERKTNQRRERDIITETATQQHMFSTVNSDISAMILLSQIVVTGWFHCVKHIKQPFHLFHGIICGKIS